MNSFILHFRPWLLALAGLIAIESAYYAAVRPSRAAWNSFLDLQFTQTETFQRLVTHDKIMAFENADPDVIQVGDSSGLHGVQPPIVMSHIPGYNYLNMSVATNLGYSGYYNLAKLQLKRSPNARYLVLYTSLLGGVPRKLLWDDDQKLMAPLIYNEFLSPLHRLVKVPTLAARREVTDYVYYMGHRFKQKNAPLSTNRGYLAFNSAFRESNGWTRETDVEGDVPTNIYKAILPGITVNQTVDPNAIRSALRALPRVTDEQFFNRWTLSRVSYFDHVYGAFAELAREHNVKLILIFNPFPETSRRPEFEEAIDWKAIKDGLKRVSERHPEIIITSFDFWPDEKFSVFSHISTPFSDESSHRVGRIMKGIIGEAHPAYRERRATALPASVEIDFMRPFSGYGWTDQAGTTNAFPMQYIGPRNKALLHLKLGSGSVYKVRSIFRMSHTELAPTLELLVNGIAVSKLSAGRIGEDFYVEHLLPLDVVNAYGGWMALEFVLGSATAKGVQLKPLVAFQRITATPIGSR